MKRFRRSGNVDYLRVHHRGGYGPDDDHLREEVIGGVDAQPDHRFGLPLADDDKLPVHQAMFQLLRDGLIHDVETTVEYDIDRSKKRDNGADRTNGHLLRIELRPR